MSTSTHLPFALPDVGEEEIEAVVEAIRSGWLSTGPRVAEFESAFAAAVAADGYALAVNSATAGLHLALEAAGIGPGDEVLVPTWTFTATAEVVRYLGAEPILVDVEPTTLSLDFEAAAQKITDRTKAVMPVHFAGRPIPHDLITYFCSSHGIEAVEDAAHAFPASSGGIPVGAGASRATVFSFYATKTITTGEGGMVVTRDKALADRIKVMRLHGINRDAFDRYRSTRPSWHYEVVAPGYKYNLTDPAAAMGLVQLRRSAAMRDKRAAIARRYDEAFAGLPIELPQPAPDGDEHAWHLYVVRALEDGVDRDRLIGSLAAAGVGSSVHFIPLHLQPYWRDRASLSEQDFPVATAEFARVLSLPISSSMADDQVERVIDAVTVAVH